MTDELDGALRRLLAVSGAEAAVVWGISRPGKAKVLSSCPLDVVPGGSGWPMAHHGAVDAVESDPERLARLLPAKLRSAVSGDPAAAQSFQLGHGLFVTVVWGMDSAVAIVPEGALDEIAEAAGRAADLQFNRGELQRLRAVVSGMHDAVVTVDQTLDQTHLNAAAAHLLGLPEGSNPIVDFRTAVTALAARATNGEEFGAVAGRLTKDPEAELEFVLRFEESPTHLLVTSKAVRHQSFAGRIWVFYDESALSQALESAERARDLLQVSANGMLDGCGSGDRRGRRHQRRPGHGPRDPR